MRFTELGLSGAYRIELELLEDERGFFARTFCETEFRGRGLTTAFVQSSISFNLHRGTLRGMHYQAAPHEEVKIVRCTSGAVYDVIVDLRSKSPTYGNWRGVELTAMNHVALYIPAGFAHGFQTLVDETELLYQMSTEYVQSAARGIRWDDEAIGIEWPIRDHVTISAQDRALPGLHAIGGSSR